MQDLFRGLCRQEAMATLQSQVDPVILITDVSALVRGGSGTPSEEPVLQRQDAHRDCARSCCARRHAIVVTCQLMTRRRARTSGIEGRVLVGRTPRPVPPSCVGNLGKLPRREGGGGYGDMSTVQSTTSTQARRIHMWHCGFDSSPNESENHSEGGGLR